MIIGAGAFNSDNMEREPLFPELPVEVPPPQPLFFDENRVTVIGEPNVGQGAPRDPPLPEDSVEAVRLAKEERRVDRRIRRVGNLDSTEESTVTLSDSYLLLEAEILEFLKSSWADDSSVVTFAGICPPSSSSKEKASQTFEILLNLAGAGDILITQTSPQPQDIFIRRAPSRPQDRSFDDISMDSASSRRPSQTPSTSST